MSIDFNKISNCQIFGEKPHLVGFGISNGDPEAAPLREIGCKNGGIAVVNGQYKLVRDGKEEPYHAIILYNYQGELELTTDTECHRIPPGSFTYIPSWIPRQLELIGDPPYYEIHFQVDIKAVNNILYHDSLTVRPSALSTKMKEAVEGLASERLSNDPGAADAARHYAELAAIFLRRELMSLKGTGRDEQKKRLDELREAIRLNPEKKWSVAEMAEFAHVSHNHFYRLTENYYNSSPMDMVMSIRMDKARSLLQFSNFSLEEIANQLGYANAFSFSKAFFKYNDIRPGAFRKSSQ